MKNRLKDSLSPYLKQHQNNPVDWYPWSEEALQRSRSEDKPIFLSIGYSACHWCHVMERESFSDPKIAEILNRYFVSIKVDREERPDLDHIYMTALQMMTGHGGWPLNIFLTPDLKPFFGGTYFSPEARYGRPPFAEVLLRLAEAFQNQRELVQKNSDQLVGMLGQGQFFEADESIDLRLVKKVLENAERSYDPKGGGLGGAPKFFHSDGIRLMLRAAVEQNNAALLEKVNHSLHQMALGGVFDHLGGGFHRYATDAAWKIPHFEKMLYDNALLVVLYLEAYQATQNIFYSDIVRRTLDWALRDMTSESGLFYSAIDADSEHEEGKFYTWSLEDLAKEIPAHFRRSFFDRFHVSTEGNFEGKNILYLESPLTVKEAADFAPICLKLLEKRNERPRPASDVKCLTSWNGLMISALAKAGAVLADRKSMQAAEKAAERLWNLCFREGILAHHSVGESVSQESFLEDYAYFADALLDLYEITQKEEYLARAKKLAEGILSQFYDSENGGFWSVRSQRSDVLLRYKEVTDGALPAPFHYAISVLSRLEQQESNRDWRLPLEKSIRSVLGTALNSPGGFHRLALVLDRWLNGSRKIVCDEGGCRLILG